MVLGLEGKAKMQRTPTYGLVVFDFDGTLADTFSWFSSVLNPTAERYGIRRVKEEEAHFLRGLDAREFLAHLGVPIWKLPFITRHLRQRAARERDAFRLFPGVEEMLGTLDAAGINIAVVSSNVEATVRHVLGPQAASMVRHYACGASLFGKARKFTRVVAKAGVAPPAVLSIGDETRDIAAARKTGLHCGAVSWGYMRRDVLEAARPDHLFDRVEDIIRTVLEGAAMPPVPAQQRRTEEGCAPPCAMGAPTPRPAG